MAKVLESSDRSDDCGASCGACAPAGACAQCPQQTRPDPPAEITAAAASSAATAASEDAGREPPLWARAAAWEQRIAAADAACAAHLATLAAPLPELGTLRLALAGRCQGIDALADGEPVAGLGPRLLRRLQRAAARWLRWSAPGAPAPAGELLRRAEQLGAGGDLGELVRAFAVDARRRARAGRAKQPARLDVAHRRALRQQAAILAAWPDWLQRDDAGRLVTDPGHRFLQVDRLPTAAELASPALRRWLRAVTAWQWYAPASAVELTDPQGRYALVPLDAARLAADGERTRGPWISHQPRRQQALDRARRAIQPAANAAASDPPQDPAPHLP